MTRTFISEMMLLNRSWVNFYVRFTFSQFGRLLGSEWQDGKWC